LDAENISHSIGPLCNAIASSLTASDFIIWWPVIEDLLYYNSIITHCRSQVIAQLFIDCSTRRWCPFDKL